MNACLLAIFMVASVFVVRASGIATSLDRWLWEARFGVDHRPVSGEIVLVDIDARSLDSLGVWPLPRRLYGQLTDQLASLGVQDIVFDVDFSAASTPEDDLIFAEAIERAGIVSLAAFVQKAGADGNSGEVVNLPQEMFLQNAWPVVVMVPMEDDSRIWRNLFGFEISGTSELSAAAFLGNYSGTTSGAFGLDYSIAIDQLTRVSLIDVLEGSADPSVFAGKKVIVGASALELRDLFPVPVFEILPGSVIQALGAETLLQNRAMTERGELIALLFASVIVLLLFLTKVEGWQVKVGILVLAVISIEVLAFGVQRLSPVLVPAASAYFLLFFAAVGVILRELGFHKVLSHIATVRRRNSERILGQVFDDSFDAIVVLDKDGNITAANQTARKLFLDEMLTGKPARSVLPAALVEEAEIALGSDKNRQPAPQILTLAGEGTKRRFIEFVVTRSDKTEVSRNRNGDFETRAVACLTCRDVTDERESAEQLRYLAQFDPVTNLANRNELERELSRKMKLANDSGQELCLVQFAVSNFDQIVATLGFSYGDRVRQAIASRLKSHLSQRTTWAAMSADVFAGVYLCETDDDRDLSVIDKIREIIGEDYTVEGARISVQLKFGCAFSEGSIGPEDILKRSGNALAKVRRDDRKQVIRFKPEMGTALQRRRKLETELFKAIARDELSLAYQPLINLEDGSTFGAEALLRWESREFGTVSPFEFIPLAEENGYIVELGAWALNRGMKEARTWQERLRLSVNISPVQFSRGDLVGTVREALERTHFPAELLDLEVTESLFIDESEDLKFHMEELKSLGCSFSLDDFGTGYSSLGYVANYPFSKIKLDKSFVRQSLTSKRDIAIIEAVLHLANGFDMSVLVEGIETQEQARVLKSLGCPMGQGYLFGKPMSSTDFALLVSKAA
ncbi:EAL domain-containing protein [Roseibium sp. SCPC15]|uniref:EAL domain-containing protein n=1 Tax=Roseibium sp. SCP15 TaxID=3141376 RepID=UPI003334FB6E